MDLPIIDTADTAAWADLSAQFKAANYITEEVRRLLSLTESTETILGNIARFSLFHLDELQLYPTPCALLARLFLLNGIVNPRELKILPARLVDLLYQFGFIGPAHDEHLLRGTVSITEYSGRYFLSDQLFENRGDDLIVHDTLPICMPPHASSFELLLALRGPAAGSSFLDAACGTGCQSILHANGQARVRGFDFNERCVMFATANALLNGSSARYTVGRWEDFAADDGRFDHIAFNPPDPEAAIGFLATRAAELLTGNGIAQLLVVCELLDEDADPAAMVERRLGGRGDLLIDATVSENSPFSLSADNIRRQLLPPDSLLVVSPAMRDSYLKDLAERGVTEVVSTVVTARRR